jgi:hypothetical protein
MLAFLKSMMSQAVAAQRAASERRAKRKVAASFNRVHTFSGRQEWMCPDCNRVHARSGHSWLTGYQYPACCTHSEGHRLYKDHATRVNV